MDKSKYLRYPNIYFFEKLASSKNMRSKRKTKVFHAQQAWWCTHVIPAHEWLRWENRKCKNMPPEMKKNE